MPVSSAVVLSDQVDPAPAGRFPAAANLQGEMKRRTFHRLTSGGVVACLLALLATLLLAAPAHAAPQYKDSDPGAGSSVQAPPAVVSVTFSEPLDDSSTMSVVNECGEVVDGGNVVVEFDEMRVDVVERHYSGPYTVNYTAVGLGGVTGTNEGSFTFTSAEGHPCDDGNGNGNGHGNGNGNGHGNGHGNGNGDGNGHGSGHGDGDGSGDQDHSEHDGSDSGTSQHDDHSAMGDTGDHGDSHETASHDGATHEAGAGHSGGHTGSSDRAQGSGHAGGHSSSGGNFASGGLPDLPADGRAVLIALVLCAVMGTIGGLFLRSSTS